jgi:hypothetical protein
MRWSYLLSADQVHKTLQVLQRTTLGPAPHKAGPVLPEATEHKKRPRHIQLEIQVLAWGPHKNVTAFNRLIED